MKKTIIYTKSLGRSVASHARPNNIFKYHVILGDSKWSVVREGQVRVLRAFTTVEQAIDFAKSAASEKTGEVVIHEKNGRIKNRISFAKQ